VHTLALAGGENDEAERHGALAALGPLFSHSPAPFGSGIVWGLLATGIRIMLQGFARRLTGGFALCLSISAFAAEPARRRRAQ
jgi:hypothetical protein